VQPVVGALDLLGGLADRGLRGQVGQQQPDPGLPVAAWISATVARPLAGSRATSTTSAPSWASALAAALPIPEVAPVTRQVLPAIAGPAWVT
jgi:hypothetical protein